MAQTLPSQQLRHQPSNLLPVDQDVRLSSPTTPTPTLTSKPSLLGSQSVQQPAATASSAQPLKHPSNTFYRSCVISFMEPVGSMSISPANRDVVLAARKGLFIIDLEDPYAPPRFLAHMTTWEAVDIQWNPHPARSNWVASTSNQKLLVWNLDRPGDPKAAATVSRIPLNSFYSFASSSPTTATSRIHAYQSVFQPGQSASTAHISASSPFGHTPLANSSSLPVPLYQSPLSSRSSAIQHILHAHTRAITDINWSPFHPEILASSSIDTWTWVWDLRTSSSSDGRSARKPAQGYSAWNAAVTQVKFNRASEHRLASTCDNKVLIWDDRKGSLPLATIEAHESKIYGIDWSRDTCLGLDRLVTCSLDRTVKFWDLSSPHAQAAIGAGELVTEAESRIQTNTPVWRARHLPFGAGVMTLPQRGSTTLSMWSKNDPETPMATFEGHSDIVKEYLFRTKGGQDRDYDDRRFQLITWSKDQTLRLWPVSEEQTKLVGHKPGAPIRVLHTRAFAADISYRDPPSPVSDVIDDGAALVAAANKRHGSTSNLTMASIVPPERATRSLLSGKGSGSRISQGSPYGSSLSAIHTALRDGKNSPLTTFSTSLATKHGDGRRLNHSSSHGNLASHLASSLSKVGQGLARSLNVGDSAMERLALSSAAKINSGRLGTSVTSTSSPFKAPVHARHGNMAATAASRVNRIKMQGRSGMILREERSLAQRRREPLDRPRKPMEKLMGAPMRFDRARKTGGATVDPVGWIANVKMQQDDTCTETRNSDDATTTTTGSGSTNNRQNLDCQKDGNVNTTTEEETDGEVGFSSQKLGEEIVAMHRKLSRVAFERVELAQRSCTFTTFGPWADHEPAFLRITIAFPLLYPRQPPKFEIEKSANITLKTRAYLLRGLTRLATRCSEMARPCTEICTRFLLGEPVQLLNEHDEDGEMTAGTRGALSFGGLTDTEDENESGDNPKPSVTMLPPRTMGASFGNNGELVVFGVKSVAVKGNQLSPPSSSPFVSRSNSRSWRGGTKSGSESASQWRSQSKARQPRAAEPEDQEEKRFLQSYMALSNAMSSLAHYSKEAGGKGEAGVRDSDVVQLMSSNFFARRMLSRRDTEWPTLKSSRSYNNNNEHHYGGGGDSRAGTATEAGRDREGYPSPSHGETERDVSSIAMPAIHALEHLSKSNTVVSIYYVSGSSKLLAPSYRSLSRPTTTSIKPPRFVRRRSHSLPSMSVAAETAASPVEESCDMGSRSRFTRTSDLSMQTNKAMSHDDMNLGTLQ